VATTTALARTTSPQRLYVGIGVLAVGIAAVGFWPTYFGPLLAGGVEKPAIIHLHAAVYVGWLAIFVTQVALAATGRVASHMKLGRFAIGYGVVVIVAGLLAAIGMFVLRVRAGDIVAAQAALLGPLLDMLVFAPLFAAAIYYRRKPELHKRLMVVATTSLLIAAVGRMSFLGQPRNLLLVHLFWAAPILLAMAHDFWRQRRVHPIYVLGLVVLVLEGPAVRIAVRASQQWRDLSAWLATLAA
jgi:hypothetical protein